MEIIIRNQALEKAFEEVAQTYCDNFPEAYEAMLALIRQEEACLVKPTGFSADGCIMSLGKMPEHLYSAIKQIFRKRLGIDDVWRDPENVRLFYRVWKDIKLKTARDKHCRRTRLLTSK